LITVYGMADSGNCYKVKLCLEQLKLPYRWVEINTTRGETRTKEFLARNPNAQVPTL
jgi:glutathione S-transferase